MTALSTAMLTLIFSTGASALPSTVPSARAASTTTMSSMIAVSASADDVTADFDVVPPHIGFDVGITAEDGRITLASRRQTNGDARKLSLLTSDDAAATTDSLDQSSEAVVDDTSPAMAPRVRARGLAEETRVFWYAAGASALTSLGVRILAFIPGLFAVGAISAMAVPFGPAVPMILFIALGAGFAVVDAAIAAVAGSLVYDRASDFYESRYVAAFAGQFLGNALATGTVGVMLGYGIMLMSGVTSLTEFIGEGVVLGFGFFSFFGFLPAVVVGFFASIAVPAALGAYAIAATATPRAGFAIDPTWDPFAPRTEALLPEDRNRSVALSPIAFPLAIPSPFGG